MALQECKTCRTRFVPPYGSGYDMKCPNCRDKEQHTEVEPGLIADIIDDIIDDLIDNVADFAADVIDSMDWGD